MLPAVWVKVWSAHPLFLMQPLCYINGNDSPVKDSTFKQISYQWKIGMSWEFFPSNEKNQFSWLFCSYIPCFSKHCCLPVSSSAWSNAKNLAFAAPRKSLVDSGDSDAEVLEAASHCPSHWVVFYPAGRCTGATCLPEEGKRTMWRKALIQLHEEGQGWLWSSTCS